MRSLDHFKVKGFKSIRDAEIELRPLNVMIGANGAGKSNFISLFNLLSKLVEGRLGAYVGRAGGADALLRFGAKHTSAIDIELRFGVNGYRCVLAPSANDALIFEEEVALFWGRGYNEPFIEMLGSGHSETQLTERANDLSVIAYVFHIISQWQVFHFHDTSDNAKIKKLGDIDDNEALRSDASNLAAFLYRLREQYPTQYRQVVETVRLAAPFFDDFTLRPSQRNEGRIQIEWRERDSDSYFNASSLSDGTLRFICLATLLLQPVNLLPSTILIDEPELGLHPYAISLLASMLQSAAVKTQVIVSTQSVPLVNQFAPEDLIVVDREGGQSIFKRLDDEDVTNWMEEYGLGDLWEKNVIGGRPRR